MRTPEEILPCFRNARYEALNRTRWDHFLSMNIPLAGRTIFEPGAGVGDQTAWLLDQGVKHIFVNDGRADNLAIIRERFGADPRVTLIEGDLETTLPEMQVQLRLLIASPARTFIFFYGVYYHLQETCPGFHIMRGLAPLGDAIAFDYLVGDDNRAVYGHDNPSTSLSQFAFRPRTETLFAGLKDIWEYVYQPKTPLNWVDPVATENRQVGVASHFSLDNDQLELV